MHYSINGKIIKSENAALTTKQPDKKFLSIIKQYCEKKRVLDYGCGKLRHSLHIYEWANRLLCVDSSEQLNRIQTINDKQTSVLDYIEKHLPKASAITIEDYYSKDDMTFDVIICSNVFSAIPDYMIREKILDSFAKNITEEGVIIISIQYRNSYFKNYEQRINCERFLDGWIINGKNGTSFYGIIEPERMINLCLKHNLSLIKRFNYDGSYVLILDKTKVITGNK